MQTVSIAAPASKSLSHRFLMAAALAGGASRLSHVLESDDTARTRELFTALGARFERIGPGEFSVTGIGGPPRFLSQERSAASPLSCYVGESGTTCRLATAILAAGLGSFRIHGAGRMHERPLADLAATLTSLGASVRYEGKAGCPPLVIDARGLDSSALPGEMADVSSDESSQYLSGLLLAAPLGRGLTLRLIGRKAVSWPYVSLTLDTLERFGIAFTVQTLRGETWDDADWRTITRAEPYTLRFCIRSGGYRAGEYAVEGDWSGASYFLAAGAVGPKAVRVSGLNRDSLQADASLIGILERMGARIAWTREEGTRHVTAFPSPLRGIDADMGHCPDLVPTVAALAAHARGRTVIRNAAHLKIKESDRLQAPAEALRKVGCVVAVGSDGLTIDPPGGGPRAPDGSELFSAHNDHRIAMSASLLGLAGMDGSGGFAVPLDEPSCVAKSFPSFWRLWEQVRASK
ncbi:MAG: 3-phosphoshikimate 1-carboxyvinyltransferase [Desulfovibrio sp.]|jgi:3-phosphoshikimate 1-carboxyvinyltransferase|nr:3-phosphoshikimate 1-carboxyvinyltransferase [Desulfovibrio sp.]